jgi:hypothetical protein
MSETTKTTRTADRLRDISAEIVTWGPWSFAKPSRDVSAAANLIDELSEALQQALLYVERDEVAHGRTFGIGKVIRAALAKAEGTP